MTKQVASKKCILLFLDSYNDLIVNSSLSEKTSAKKEIREAILVDNSDSQVAAQLSVSSALLDGDMPTAPSPTPESDQTFAEEQSKFISVQLTERVFDHLAATGLSSSKIERSKRIIKLLSRFSKVILDTSSCAIVLNSDTKGGANACLRSTRNLIDFLTNLQSPNKKILQRRFINCPPNRPMSLSDCKQVCQKLSASHVLAASTCTAS